MSITDWNCYRCTTSLHINNNFDILSPRIDSLPLYYVELYSKDIHNKKVFRANFRLAYGLIKLNKSLMNGIQVRSKWKQRYWRYFDTYKPTAKSVHTSTTSHWMVAQTGSDSTPTCSGSPQQDQIECTCICFHPHRKSSGISVGSSRSHPGERRKSTRTGRSRFGSSRKILKQNRKTIMKQKVSPWVHAMNIGSMGLLL